MATKTKVATKKSGKSSRPVRAKTSVLEIQIMPDGSVPDAYLDPYGRKHPSKVYWSAVDPTQSYQIVLDSPPLPFKNGDGPFPTDSNGDTDILTTDKHDSNGDYGYSVMILTARSKWRRLSAADIIIDA